MKTHDHSRTRPWGRLHAAALTLMACGLVMTTPSASFAAGEVTGVIGGLIGGDLGRVRAGNISIGGAFDDGAVYGVRVGWMGRFVGAEGSFVASPRDLSLSFSGLEAGLNGKASFLEGNVLLVPIPGPVSPFVTVGAGLHSYALDVDFGALSAEAKVQKFGFNFGGGVKFNIKALTIRGEVRDHVTRVGPGDFDPPVALDLFDDETLHNIEISGGIGIRF